VSIPLLTRASRAAWIFASLKILPRFVTFPGEPTFLWKTLSNWIQASGFIELLFLCMFRNSCKCRGVHPREDRKVARPLYIKSFIRYMKCKNQNEATIFSLRWTMWAGVIVLSSTSTSDWTLAPRGYWLYLRSTCPKGVIARERSQCAAIQVTSDLDEKARDLLHTQMAN
jgi:hypothetical protein